jgi:predicted amidohydrolase YtcJ
MMRFEHATVWRGGRTAASEPLLVVGGHVAPASGGDATTIDLGGAHVVPGFVDAHTHLTVAAWVPWFADGSAWRSAAEACAAIARAAAARGSGWLLAFNVDDDAWPDGPPTAAALEAAAPGRPTLVAHLSLHRAILSETAMRRLDVSGTTPDPAGDIETRRGRPTGRIWESAFGRAVTTALLETARTLEPGRLDLLLDGEAERHLALGITAAHDPCVPIELLPAMTRLAGRTRLRLSWSHVHGGGILDPAPPDVAARGSGDGPPSAKVFLDGAHRCAMCLDPRHVATMAWRAVTRLVGHRDPGPLRELLGYRIVYRHPRFHMPYLRFADDGAEAVLGGFATRGVRARIHALGNDAVAQACRTLRRLDVRNASLEHLVVLSDREVAAVADAGVIASLQPGFLPHYGPALLDRGIVGRLRAVPAESLRRAGVPLALSSDHPCGPLDPLVNIRCAVQRRLDDGRPFDEAEAIATDVAVDAYTRGGFQAIHGAPGPGLDPGAPADFAVLSGPPDAAGTRVLRTWIAGREAWRSPEQPALA